LALMCLTSWGIFGFLSKISSKELLASQMQVLFTLGTLPLFVPAWLRAKTRLDRDKVGMGLGVTAGLLAALANLALFSALRQGEVSIVAPVTALYPLVTLALAALVLKEKMNRYQCTGVLLAVIAIFLLSA
jgi:transporter family protein